MSPTAPRISDIDRTPSTTSSVDQRLARLEQGCAELWADEPGPHIEREMAFALLCELEHRVVRLGLRAVAEPDDSALELEVERCERDLHQVAALWATPRAA